MSCLAVFLFLLLVFGGLLGLFLAAFDGLADRLKVHGALVVLFHYMVDENWNEVSGNVVLAVGSLLVV